MAQVTGRRVAVVVDAKVTLVLTEKEARALDGIFGYSVEQFLKVFYEKMGAAYVKPHEEGVRTLHETIRGQLSEPLALIDKARRQVTEALSKPNP